ncbi:MAG: hypothetical protein COS90_02380 [Deltaproteobacteria bacterium CG07_land_8_20_14_0_80_60_11]|nr:MAG: hypothetical protein COS90_02380 [Deltaproteobacteria bacterium CG07_land_8_20_14_0_80_60_11]
MAWFGGFTLETYNRIPGDYEEVTVGVSVVGFSQAKIMPTTGPYARMSARAALVSSENGDIRFRVDGGLPSISSGHYFTSGDTLVLTGTQAIQQFRAIRNGETNGVLRVTYFY